MAQLRPRTRALLVEQRGASSIEYTVMLVLVALIGLASWYALGDSVETKVDCAATSIGSLGLGGGPCGGGDGVSVAATGAFATTGDSAGAPAARSTGALTEDEASAGPAASASSDALSADDADGAGDARRTASGGRGDALLGDSSPTSPASGDTTSPASGDGTALTGSDATGGGGAGDASGVTDADATDATGVTDSSSAVTSDGDASDPSDAESSSDRGAWGWLDDHLFSPIGSAASTGGSFLKGLTLGVWDGGKGLVVGTAKLLWGAHNWLWDSGLHPLDFRFDRLWRAANTMTSIGSGAWDAITHPGDTWDTITQFGGAVLHAAWNGLGNAWDTLLHGDAEERGHLVGEIGFNVALFAIPVTKAGSAAKIAEIARADEIGVLAAEGADAARIGGVVNGVLRLGRIEEDIAIGADLMRSARVSDAMAADVARDALRTAALRGGRIGGIEDGAFQLGLERTTQDLARSTARTIGQSYDDVAARWEGIPNAFGQTDTPIQFAWELEGTSNDILRYYRPREVAEADWQAMSMQERLAHPHEGSYYNYVRMDDAPAYLSAKLKNEVTARVWETTTDSYANTVGELFDQATFVNDRLGGGFHWHVSFPYSEAQVAHADEIADFLATGNEYTTLRMFASHPSNIHHNYLGPYTSERIEKIRTSLLSGSGANDKFSTFSMRTGKYGDSGRIGFEIRAINYDLQDASRAVDNTVRFLEDPSNASIRFGAGEGSAYDAAAVHGVDRLSSSTIERLSPETQEWLRAAKSAARDGHAPIERWLVPMVRWEERSFLSPYSRQIEQARERFVQSLERMRAAGEPTAASQSQIENLVYNWARETRLWEHY